ncbi:hypothetical protein ACFL5S_00340 [Fibrobacterota bacterium]
MEKQTVAFGTCRLTHCYINNETIKTDKIFEFHSIPVNIYCYPGNGPSIEPVHLFYTSGFYMGICADSNDQLLHSGIILDRLLFPFTKTDI